MVLQITNGVLKQHQCSVAQEVYFLFDSVRNLFGEPVKCNL